MKMKRLYIRGLYVRVTWNVCTSISVQSCGPMTLPPAMCDEERVSFVARSSMISWLLSSIFSDADVCWSAAIVTRTSFTVFIVSRERDLHASTTAAAAAAVEADLPLPFAPFSLLRRDELRCNRCFSLEEVLRRLGRFTDSALALKPAAEHSKEFDKDVVDDKKKEYEKISIIFF